ncbi:radical SAM protein [Heliobacterium undosum]|uniref:Radical SAM protein n=1 Tax=Heliomicrobium undosum TaxID=121734 RepID=A0A845L5U4_9FIRM|nr:radical SAM protein [Heliomicrobium undosum]MZP30214.1 radical SAM protein [Heliomicrobium undosum]
MLHARDFVLRGETFGGMVVHLPTDRVLRVNHTAFAFLRHYFEDLPDPLARLSLLYPRTGRERLQRDYEGMVRYLEAWVAGEHPEKDAVAVKAHHADGPLSAPTEVFWEITWKCNLRCRYCYNHSGERTVEELTTGECQDLIQQWQCLGVYKAIIGGGEPFLREDFLEILEMLEAASIIPIVISNGTLIDEQMAARLKRLRWLRLSISLDGPTAEVNDAIRVSSDGFRRVQSALAALRKAGMPFTLQAVVTQINQHCLADLAEFARQEGATSLEYRRLHAFGRSRGEHLAVGREEMEELDGQLERISASYPAKFLNHEGLVPMRYAQGKPYQGNDCPNDTCSVNCGPGRHNCGLTPDGRIIACSYLSDADWQGPSIREMPFSELWRTAKPLIQFRSLSAAELPEYCRKCVFFGEECRGGCRANAYIRAGDWFGHDPDCPYSEFRD